MRTSGRSCLTENWLEDCGVESALLPDTMTMIPDHLFASCGRLRTVRLPARLELICQESFRDCGLRRLEVPRGVRRIEERAFCGCGDLWSVSFEAGSRLEEVGFEAFYGAGLGSFAAPPSLRKVGDLAFGGCAALKDLRLHDGVQELGWLCLWVTAVCEVRLPQCAKLTPEQLGVGQYEADVFRIPPGLDTEHCQWF